MDAECCVPQAKPRQPGPASGSAEIDNLKKTLAETTQQSTDLKSKLDASQKREEALQARLEQTEASLATETARVVSAPSEVSIVTWAPLAERRYTKHGTDH